jgi:hypothetical protein
MKPGKSDNYRGLATKETNEKEAKAIFIGVITFIVFLLAVGWVAFAVASIIRGGSYIWLAVIVGAIIVGAIVAYLSIISPAKSKVHLVEGEITSVDPVTDAEHISIDKDCLITTDSDGIARAIRIKVANDDTLAHQAIITVGINEQTSNPISTGITIDPGATMDVEMPLPTKVSVDDIDSLSVVLRQIL